ncbi:MAG: hypothetical protein LBR22_05790 [Desulfovibrio sp.]|jgi:hypothetical protein|nr:hypothetical protein [Desulfovibrio sp.]
MSEEQTVNTLIIAAVIYEFNFLISCCEYDTHEMLSPALVSYECYLRDVLAAFICGTDRVEISKEILESPNRSDVVAKLDATEQVKIYIYIRVENGQREFQPRRDVAGGKGPDSRTKIRRKTLLYI